MLKSVIGDALDVILIYLILILVDMLLQCLVFLDINVIRLQLSGKHDFSFPALFLRYLGFGNRHLYIPTIL